MKLSTLVLALAAQTTVQALWGSKAVYNKWHETELERWLSDHNIPYPTPADRKDLENLVKTNWNDKVVTPFNEWEAPQLLSHLQAQGRAVEETAEADRDLLVAQVRDAWTDTTDSVADAYGNVRDWIFDSWTESQLKSFADKHGIPVPQPRRRDVILKAVRSNYETVAKKANQYASYPGNWLYETWSESELKQFLDERGIPVPQPTTRDRLVATVRRNARSAALTLQSAQASAASSASAAQQSLTDLVFDAWSDSDIKKWADESGIKVPQGSTRNELLALARRHRAQLLGDAASATDKAASAFGAATSKAGNEYARATDKASLTGADAFDAAVNTWSDSRLKAYLDERGVPAPQSSKRDELLAKVRLHKHKAATGYSAWTFDTWSTENLKKYLASQNNKLAKKSSASRDELLRGAQDQYSKAAASGGAAYASVTSYLASATDAAKSSTFDTWSESELKRYLDSYGVKAYQGSTLNELRALARNQATYFRYGTTTPGDTVLAKLQASLAYVWETVLDLTGQGASEAEKAGDYAKEKGTQAKNRAGEAAQKAGDRAKEEL